MPFAMLSFFLKPFTGVMLLAAIAAGSYLYGNHVARQDCARQKQESIAIAREVDTEAARFALKAMDKQRELAAARAVEAEKRVKDYEAQLQNKPECSLDDDDVRALGGVPVGPKVPGGSQNPPANR